MFEAFFLVGALTAVIIVLYALHLILKGVFGLLKLTFGGKRNG